MRPTEPDPSTEFFDVIDAEGVPTGEVKSRLAVHRDGDWHRAFHCWVVLRLEDGSPAIVFQRRSSNKDTHPRELDVAVGGHYRAGEGFEDVIREMEEELGITAPPEALQFAGRRRAVGRGPTWIDREIEDVYVYCLAMPVSELRPAYEEITALDVVRLVDLEDIFSDRRDTIRSIRYEVLPDNTLARQELAWIALDDFIAVTDGYWVKGARAAVQVLEGCSGVQLDLWPLNDL
jgi:isopentenyldiphosphate isomerase